jgi:TolB-like protein
MSRDEDNEYFADGLSEELLNVLAKIRGLRVASRTSAFYFKGKDIDLGTVAQKLGVATVLEASVRKSGKRVRITAQLIEASSDSHLWSETYDRELDDIFAVQDDIAQSVVRELRSALLGERIDARTAAAAQAEVKAAAAGRADDPEAYRLYLQGRFLLDRLNLAEVTQSIDLFHQALSRDPGFALAWCGLSQAHAIQAGYGGVDVAEGYERAREAAKRALALAPDSADAYVRLGNVHEMFDWDWQAANDAYQHALALAPSNPSVLLAVAGISRVLGGAERAIELYRQAIALVPLSSAAHRNLGLRLLRMGRLDEASAAIATAVEINPSAGLVWCLVAAIRREQGRYDEALAAAERERLADFRQLALGMVHHAMGHREAADAALRKLCDGWGHAAAYQIAMLHAVRGEVDAGFEWLERAYAQRDPGLVNLACDSPFANALHADPRWLPFLRKMKLA